MLNFENSIFKNQYTLQQRIQKCTNKLYAYPDMIPLIVEKHPKSQLSPLPKNLFLVTKEFKLNQFRQMIRKSMNLSEKKTFFFYIGNYLLPDDSDLSEQYRQRKDQDGFLYITYSDLDVFGQK